MFEWFASTLRQYPEIAIFLSLAFGYYVGSFTYKGLGLGAVTATLIAAVIIGQLDIPTPGPLKPFFFLMFLFAIGYAVGHSSCAASPPTASHRHCSPWSCACSASSEVTSPPSWPAMTSGPLQGCM